ncbi:MAG: hypothetical protein RLY31_2607 [Bacteroidota bacterium]
MNHSAHLLYVEDDASLGFVTHDNLEKHGYRVTHCLDGTQALEMFRSQPFDLCILDVMLPGTDGFALAMEIRNTDLDIPILFLTAKSLEEDKIQGLRLGADDYIVKPFSMEELILKIEIFLRRRNILKPTPRDIYQLSAFTFDYPNLSLQGPDTAISLTQREADLLRLFAEQPNTVIKRADILRQLWGEDDYFLGRSLDVFISRLRKYLQPDDSLRIENIHGVGFRFHTPQN